MSKMLRSLLSRAGLILFAFDKDDPDTKAAIAAAVEEAVRPLVAKRDELLGEVKKLRKSAEITPEQLAAVEQERDEAIAARDKAIGEGKKAAGEVEKLRKSLENESAFTSKLLVDNGLQSALMEHGVKNPAHLKAATALLRGGVQIKVDGENRSAMVGDKPLSDFVKEWAAGDDGKHFVSATPNTGGGAPGGNGNTQAKTMTRTAFEALPPAQRVEFSKTGGVLTE